MKSIPVTDMLKKSLLDLPTPAPISLMWNLGFMLGLTLTMQIITGLVISMSYIPNTNMAFTTTMLMERNINTGWATRFMHMNGASLFFILLYFHTARGLYFASPKNQKPVWITGILMLLTIMATAFLGYVLPWGQMSFWGATVITGVLSAIPLVGMDLVTWLWGGPSVNQPTLNRFFSLHFLTPMIAAFLMMTHLIMLHTEGSSTPNNTESNSDKVKFHPLFSTKDTTPTFMLSTMMMLMICNYPNTLGDVENFNLANPLVAPVHIQPEWYFLFAYVILRSIPSKLGGVVALLASVMVLAIPMTTSNTTTKFNPNQKMKFWLLISTIIILTWIGSKTVESPYEKIGQVYTVVYFTILTTI